MLPAQEEAHGRDKHSTCGVCVAGTALLSSLQSDKVIRNQMEVREVKYTKAGFVRWIYFNPETGVFIETMPQSPNLLGMSGGLSLARALMFATEAEARSWEKDVKELNPKFRVTKVILEYEADKCPETVDCGPCEKCLTAKGYKVTPCFHKCAKHNK